MRYAAPCAGPERSSASYANEHSPAPRSSSWGLGSLSGIPLRVHPTFFLLLGWVALSHLLSGEGLRGVAGGLLLVLSVFACVILHELSHARVARRFGIRTRSITLLPIGGIARLERLPERPSQELWVALAGPVMNLVIASALFCAQWLVGLWASHPLSQASSSFLTNLMWINVGLATFNLLPAFPMDGGRIFRAALAMRLGRDRATRVAARVGQAMAVLLGATGLLYNPMLVLIAVFVWAGAKAEASMTELKATLRGLPVWEAMIRDFRLLAPTDPLSHAAQLALSGFQQDFPIVDGERVVGVLTRANLLKGVTEGELSLPVGQVMEQQFEFAAPGDMLDAAFERLQASRCNVLVVLDRGHVVGLVSPENVGHLLTLERARHSSHAHPLPWTS